MTHDEKRIEELCTRLEDLMAEYNEFRVFISIFQRNGSVSWTVTESLCLACVIEYLNEMNKNIKHLEFEELIH